MNGPDPMEPEHGLPEGLSVLNVSGFEIPLADSELERIAAAVFAEEGVSGAAVELVYVDETEMLELNREHRGGEYVTDSLAFSYHESPDAPVEGTLVQCAQRIAEQAEEFEQPLNVEFARLLIHGLLHLAGHEDETSEQKERMTRLEDKYLSLAGYGTDASG